MPHTIWHLMSSLSMLVDRRSLSGVKTAASANSSSYLTGSVIILAVDGIGLRAVNDVSDVHG